MAGRPLKCPKCGAMPDDEHEFLMTKPLRGEWTAQITGTRDDGRLEVIGMSNDFQPNTQYVDIFCRACKHEWRSYREWTT